MNAASAIDYESIFLHAPVGMCMSENRIMRSCNEALASMFGYATDLRSKTQGRATYSMEPSHFVELPKSLQEKIIHGSN